MGPYLPNQKDDWANKFLVAVKVVLHEYELYKDKHVEPLSEQHTEHQKIQAFPCNY